jgi:protoporphyrinogen oxidase
MKTAIIGTGISGLSVAHLLKDRHEVKLIEKKETPGGLIKCDRIQDCLFHRVGGHVFNSKNQSVLDWFWKFFNREEEFIQAKRNANIFLKNQIIGYPIENHIHLLEAPLVREVVKELTALQRKEQKAPFDYDNFEAFLKGSFGDALYQLYFGPYNKKIWKTELNKVAMEWLEGKLPMPDFEEIVYKNIVREQETGMVHSSFYYPKFNGSQFIVERLMQGLNIECSANTDGLLLDQSQWHLNGEAFDAVIFTGDVRALPNAAKAILADHRVDLLALANLKSNGTSNLFCETDDTDISWLYIPEAFTRAHRIIYTGNFSSTNNRGSSRKTCVVEFSGEVSLEDMKAEIKKLPGHLSPIDYNYEPNSYVIQEKGTRALIQQIKKTLEPHRFYLLGRFAEWEYYNMDKAIESAMNLSVTHF